MTPSFYTRLIHSWNSDPLMANIVKGRTLQAQELDHGIVVSWRTASTIKVYPIPYSAICGGWSDALTDLMETLEAERDQLHAACDKAITYMTHEQWLEYEAWLRTNGGKL